MLQHKSDEPQHAEYEKQRQEVFLFLCIDVVLPAKTLHIWGSNDIGK
jgi:hypothetical protein